MLFRLATVEDLPAIKQLAIRSWSVYQQELLPDNWTRLYHILSNETTYADLLIIADCIVCETGGQLAGMAFLVPNGNPTDIYNETWSYIRFLSVAPEYSGKGIARSLTNECIKLAKDNGETIIALHTSEMMHAARHIYESLGFVIEKELEPRFGKRYWLYVKDIS